jgi:hypothetical protein
MPRLPKVFIAGLLVFIGVSFFFLKTQPAESAAGHVVISEIQIAGQNGDDDEFVELYNPTGMDISLAGWRLGRFNSSGTYGNLVLNLTGTIKAHGYFLITHPSYSGIPSPNAFYSAPSNALTNHHAVILYQDAGITAVDLVGLGSNPNRESVNTSNPSVKGSVERKPNTSAVLASMVPGGLDALEGNGEDTNNNAQDFIVRTQSDPQNNLIQEALADADYTAIVTLSPAQEVPPVTANSSGIATVEINTAQNILSYTLAHQNLSGAQTLARIHGPAAPGNNAPAVINLQTGSPANGSWQYLNNQENDLLNSFYYFNINTYSYPDGEIRGQIFIIDPVPTPTITPQPTPTSNPTPTSTPSPSPTPTPTPTATFTPTPTPSPSPTPTSTPVPTPTPTPSPEPTPTSAPLPTPIMTSTPSPTSTPIPTPTSIPEPSPTPLPTPPVSPSPAISATPAPPNSSFNFLNVQCRTSYLNFWFFGRTIRMPFTVCRPLAH